MARLNDLANIPSQFQSCTAIDVQPIVSGTSSKKFASKRIHVDNYFSTSPHTHTHTHAHHHRMQLPSKSLNLLAVLTYEIFQNITCVCGETISSKAIEAFAFLNVFTLSRVRHAVPVFSTVDTIPELLIEILDVYYFSMFLHGYCII